MCESRTEEASRIARTRNRLFSRDKRILRPLSKNHLEKRGLSRFYQFRPIIAQRYTIFNIIAAEWPPRGLLLLREKTYRYSVPASTLEKPLVQPSATHREVGLILLPQ